MLKYYKIFLISIFILCLTNSFSEGKNKEKQFLSRESTQEKDLSQWKIDEAMKFHFAYLPLNQLLPEPVEKPEPLGFTNNYLPDINNINLASIKGLGFFLPEYEKNENYNLYLKLFTFPKNFPTKFFTFSALEEFYLDKMKEAEILADYMSERKNLAIKKAFIASSGKEFSEKEPFPSLLVPVRPSEKALKVFKENILFYSLYVNPNMEKPDFNSNDELAQWSAEGVVSFHQDLIQVYRENLLEVDGIESETYFYFLEYEGDNKLSVLKIPKEPLVFQNWRDLPMPEDMEKIFLSGLLLIFRTEYTKNDGLELLLEDMIVDSDHFQKVYKQERGIVFEVGSVVKI